MMIFAFLFALGSGAFAVTDDRGPEAHYPEVVARQDDRAEIERKLAEAIRRDACLVWYDGYQACPSHAAKAAADRWERQYRGVFSIVSDRSIVESAELQERTACRLVGRLKPACKDAREKVEKAREEAAARFQGKRDVLKPYIGTGWLFIPR